MKEFDSIVHSMTTVSTGGFANYDASFSIYDAEIHYACVVFMVLAAMPFVRFVQLTAGTAKPLLQDPQVRAFFGTIVVIVVALTLWRFIQLDNPSEATFRAALFNTISVLLGVSAVTPSGSA